MNNQNKKNIISAVFKLFELLDSQDKRKFFVIFLSALCVSIMEILTAYTAMKFAQILNDVSIGKELFKELGFENILSPQQIIFYTAVLFGIVFILKNLVMLFDSYNQVYSINMMSLKFKEKMMVRLSERDYITLISGGSTYNKNLITGESERLFSIGVTPLGQILLEGTVFIFLTAFIFYSNPSLAIIILSLTILVGYPLGSLLLPKFLKWGDSFRGIRNKEFQSIMDFFQGFKEIIMSGSTKFFINEFFTHSKLKHKVISNIIFVNSTPRSIVELTFILIFIIAVYNLSWRYEGNTNEIISILSLYLYAGFRLAPCVNRIFNYLNSFKTVVGSVYLLNYEYLAEHRNNQVNEKKFKFDKIIELSRVSFKYPGKKKNTLNDINLEIKKGDNLGIMGKTGSGKSTLVNIIMGLFSPTNGNVIIDQKFRANSISWRKQIGLVPQKAFLIDDTISKNIVFGSKIIDEKKIYQSIEKSQLSSLINKLPDGLNTMVGDRGIKLSGGEQQRIAIARALYHGTKILILDEATSSLDVQTEKKILSTINDIANDLTIISISHRLSALKFCKEVIKVENGSLKKLNLKKKI